jgi:hypothetical protein
METAETADNSELRLLSRECSVSPRSKTDDLIVAGNMSKSSGEAIKLNLNNCYWNSK